MLTFTFTHLQPILRTVSIQGDHYTLICSIWVSSHSSRMPKKFAGENSKAVVARQRKEDKKQEEIMKKKKQEEDEYWRDDDKNVARKNQRKVRLLS